MIQRPLAAGHASFTQTLADRIDRQQRRRRRGTGGQAAIRDSVEMLQQLQRQCAALHRFTHWHTLEDGPSYTPALIEKFQDARRVLHASGGNVPAASLRQRLERLGRVIAAAAAQQFDDDARQLVAAGHWGLFQSGCEGMAQLRFRGRIDPHSSPRDLLAEVELGLLHEPDDPLLADDANELPDRVYDFTVVRTTPLAQAVGFRRTHQEAATLFEDLIEPLRPELTLLRGVYLEPGSFQELPGYCVTLGPYVIAFDSEEAPSPFWQRPGRAAGLVAVTAAIAVLTVMFINVFRGDTRPPDSPLSASSARTAATGPSSGQPRPALRAGDDGADWEDRLWQRLWDDVPQEK